MPEATRRTKKLPPLMVVCKVRKGLRHMPSTWMVLIQPGLITELAVVFIVLHREKRSSQNSFGVCVFGVRGKGKIRGWKSNPDLSS